MTPKPITNEIVTSNAFYKQFKDYLHIFFSQILAKMNQPKRAREKEIKQIT